MTDARRDRLRFLRTRVEGRPEAARDWFGYAARCMRDRLGFWRFRLTKRAAAAWDWIMWVAEGPMWTLKRKAKERAIAREAGLRPARAVPVPGAIRRRAVLLASAGALAVSFAVGAATIDFTSGPEDDHVATAGTSFMANMQEAVPAGERAARAAKRAHNRRARAHRARVAAQRRHRAAMARAKRLKLARARARRAAAARVKQVAATSPSPSASTPTTAPQPVAPAPAPVPVRSAPAPAPAPAPKPQAGVVFDDER